ncbi:MAG: hypothetical protein EZS28_019073 [Streblomastix strix]|uniref:Uncharacterized protein n=1 Tax=Streblomastix strix TaxID=222440 RepID=A0A5J4VS37_9EUKA|nr:MAG: hypothetical protein EZS28_019073 [Streblomastix strix]
MLEDLDDDPVVEEYEVLLNDNFPGFSLWQYPLRSNLMPYDFNRLRKLRAKPHQHIVELTFQSGKPSNFDFSSMQATDPRGKRTFSLSSQIVRQYSNTMIGYISDGRVFLTPLASILQLHPTFDHLNSLLVQEQGSNNEDISLLPTTKLNESLQLQQQLLGIKKPQQQKWKNPAASLIPLSVSMAPNTTHQQQQQQPQSVTEVLGGSGFSSSYGRRHAYNIMKQSEADEDWIDCIMYRDVKQDPLKEALSRLLCGTVSTAMQIVQQSGIQSSNVDWLHNQIRLQYPPQSNIFGYGNSFDTSALLLLKSNQNQIPIQQPTAIIPGQYISQADKKDSQQRIQFHQIQSRSASEYFDDVFAYPSTSRFTQSSLRRVIPVNELNNSEFLILGKNDDQKQNSQQLEYQQSQSNLLHKLLQRIENQKTGYFVYDEIDHILLQKLPIEDQVRVLIRRAHILRLSDVLDSLENDLGITVIRSESKNGEDLIHHSFTSPFQRLQRPDSKLFPQNTHISEKGIMNPGMKRGVEIREEEVINALSLSSVLVHGWWVEQPSPIYQGLIQRVREILIGLLAQKEVVQLSEIPSLSFIPASVSRKLLEDLTEPVKITQNSQSSYQATHIDNNLVHFKYPIDNDIEQRFQNIAREQANVITNMYKQAKEAVNFLLGLSDIINKGE